MSKLNELRGPDFRGRFHASWVRHDGRSCSGDLMCMSLEDFDGMPEEDRTQIEAAVAVDTTACQIAASKPNLSHRFRPPPDIRAVAEGWIDGAERYTPLGELRRYPLSRGAAIAEIASEDSQSVARQALVAAGLTPARSSPR